MTQTNQILVFDRALVRRHQIRAAKHLAAHSALFDDMRDQLHERLSDVKRRFPTVLDIGGLCGDFPDAHLVILNGAGAALVADEEFLPFAAHRFDLIVSNACLHWVNDLPGALLQIKQSLKSEGLFLAAILGGNTLHELRHCLIDAELAVMGGISPRLSPVVDLQTASGLLQRAGFALPVADSERVTLLYPDLYALMRDLRGMGQTNAHSHRLRHPTRRAVFDLANHLYKERYGLPEGLIPATFEIIFLHGWG